MKLMKFFIIIIFKNTKLETYTRFITWLWVHPEDHC